MLGHKITFIQDICETRITTIQGIYFTLREIDVLACLVNSRGTSKTASLLSIAPKTAVNHIHNIMQKINCNARDSIIDFVERSHALPQLRNHYSQLLLHSFFEKCLKDISKVNREKAVICLIAKQSLSEPLLSRITAHLRLLGLEVKTRTVSQKQSFWELTDIDNEAAQLIYFLKEQEFETLKLAESGEQRNFSLQKKQPVKSPIILIEKRSETQTEMVNAEVQTSYNYYLTFFEILRTLSSQHLEKKFREFQEFYKSVLTSYESLLTSVPSKENSRKDSVILFKNLSSFIDKKDRRKLLTYAALGIISGLSFVLLNIKRENSHFLVNQNHFQSNINRFSSNALLEQPKLKAQLRTMFTNKNTIQIIALVGIGGAGKTTLARQYALEEKATIKWELNAETLISLRNSLESLAKAVALTNEDEIKLKEIQTIKDADEEEQKILTFIQQHFKNNSGWLLIYDNVDNLSEVQKYLPHNAELWGNGRIILTTRDATVQNNSWINDVLQLGELSPEQKYEIFIKITGHKKTSPGSKSAKETRDFLENIPPYPLDVSLAAYYLKAVNSTYSAYLDILKECSHEFDHLQRDILISTGNYNKTRYGIITSSLQQIMSNGEFEELLLFISVINSRNITKALLEIFKKPSIVDSFIYSLKKYSLISFELNPLHAPTFSIHRSTQELLLAHLVETLKIGRNPTTVQKVLNAFEAYIDTSLHNDDIAQIIFLIDHAVSFYQKKHILSDAQRARLVTKIAWLIRRGLGDNKRAEVFLKESLEIYNKNPHLDPDNLALVLGQLGYIERKKGNYIESVKLLEHALTIYKERGKQFDAESAYLSVHLGISYKYLGEYKKAQLLLQNAQEIYKKVYGENDYNYIWAIGVLGNIFNDTGHYTKGYTLLKKAYDYILKKFGLEHVETMITAMKLGVSLREMGDYASSQEMFTQTTEFWKKMNENGKGSAYKTDYAFSLIEQGLTCIHLLQFRKAIENIAEGLQLIREHYGESNIKTAWAIACLGKAYGKKGEFKEAKSLLVNALNMYEKFYGNDHLETARIQRTLGEIHFQEGFLEEAQIFLRKALNVLSKNSCAETGLVLESLADINFSKASKLNNQDSEKSQEEGYKFLKQAFDKVRQDYPAKSPHFIRIHNKLENFVRKHKGSSAKQ